MTTVDVLVIGGGPPGPRAPLAADDAGARVVVVEKRQESGGNAPFAGGFLWDVRGAEAVRHVQTLFFGKTDRSVAEAYVTGLGELRSWIGELGGETVDVGPPPGSFPAVLPSWPHVPGSDGVGYWVVGGQPALRRGEALWQLLSRSLSARGIAVRHGPPATARPSWPGAWAWTRPCSPGRSPGSTRRPPPGGTRSSAAAPGTWPPPTLPTCTRSGCGRSPARRRPVQQLDEVALRVGHERHPHPAFRRGTRRHDRPRPAGHCPVVRGVQVGDVERHVPVPFAQRGLAGRAGFAVRRRTGPVQQLEP